MFNKIKILYIKSKILISMILAIATFLTAFATYYTVDEMKKNRILSYKPILKLLTNEYKITASVNKKINKILFNHPMNYNLSVNNFGNGVALNIKCKWTTDNKILKKYVLNDIQKDHISINALKDKYIIKIPIFYVRAYEKYLKLKYLNQYAKYKIDTWIIDSSEFPPLKLTMTYTDLNNKEYIQNFIFKIKEDDISLNTKNMKYTINIKYNVEEHKI